MVKNQLRTSLLEGHLLDIRDLEDHHMYNNDLETFHNEWEYKILNIRDGELPEDKILLYWYHREIEHHPGLKDEMRDWRKWKYDNPLDSRLNIDTLKKWVKQYLTRRELESNDKSRRAAAKHRK